MLKSLQTEWSAKKFNRKEKINRGTISTIIENGEGEKQTRNL